MSTKVLFRWDTDALRPVPPREGDDATIAVADSWLVSGGRALALDAHRARFFDSIPPRLQADLDAASFWDAAVDRIPIDGAWFPRVEFHSAVADPHLALLLRPAPRLSRSLTVATHHGDDPRTAPTVKGPDLAALADLRAEARHRGADEAVILAPPSFVSDGASTAVLWWRGETLCAPPPEFERVNSVTARSILTLATGLGVGIQHRAVTPAELDGLEVWAVNALHGIRIVTAWIDGPKLAEQPGRLDVWRARLEALRRPIHAAPIHTGHP